jgi:hypothetical protein
MSLAHRQEPSSSFGSNYLANSAACAVGHGSESFRDHMAVDHDRLSVGKPPFPGQIAERLAFERL